MIKISILEKVRGPSRDVLRRGLELRATTNGLRLLRLVEDRDGDVTVLVPGSALHRSRDLDLVAHRVEPLVDALLKKGIVVTDVKNLYAFHVFSPQGTELPRFPRGRVYRIFWHFTVIPILLRMAYS